MKNPLVKIATEESTQISHRAQLIWSLCVAFVTAVVVLQQAMSSHTQRSIASQAETRSPQALVSGKPLPISSQEVQTPPQNVIQ